MADQLERDRLFVRQCAEHRIMRPDWAPNATLQSPMGHFTQTTYKSCVARGWVRDDENDVQTSPEGTWTRIVATDAGRQAIATPRK